MHRLLAYRLPLESKLLLNVRDCADEYGQPGGIVDDGIDERPVEDNTAPIFPIPCGRRLNRGCRARLCALFIHGDICLVEHTADINVAVGRVSEAGKIRKRRVKRTVMPRAFTASLISMP